MSGFPFAGYPASALDEAVGPDGRPREAYAVVEQGLRRLGAAGLPAAVTALGAEHAAQGVTVGSWSDGRLQVRPLPLDPVPRVVTAAE